MNSIFRKQFFLLTAGLIFSFLLLTVGIVQALNTSFYRQKENEMLKQAHELENIIERCYVGTSIDNDLISQEIVNKNLSFAYNFAILGVDNGSIEWNLNQEDASINLADLSDGKLYKTVFSHGDVTFKHSRKNKTYVLDYPVIYDNNKIADVFLSTSTDELKATAYDSYRIIVIFMCLAIVFNFVVIYYSSRSFAQPLKQMSEAARVISGGDFEKRLNINSDDEIGDLADSFNEMAQSLFYQEKRRREFISNISHDLRSPLTSMKGFLQAMLDGTVSPDKQEHYLQIVLDESERLVKMANDMLDINKLDDSENSLNPTKFNLNDLIDKTLLNFEGRALENKIKISSEFCNKDIIVIADFDKIQRVLYNLVDNALKFTHKYGYIKAIVEIKDKKVYVSVKDNGKGISAEEQKMVFDRLYKGDKSRGKDKKGSGLGLCIVKEFIKAHNEEITLKSEMGKGCTFTFTLPLINKGEAVDNE